MLGPVNAMSIAYDSGVFRLLQHFTLLLLILLAPNQYRNNWGRAVFPGRHLSGGEQNELFRGGDHFLGRTL